VVDWCAAVALEANAALPLLLTDGLGAVERRRALSDIQVVDITAGREAVPCKIHSTQKRIKIGAKSQAFFGIP
jgi:hypothetical protein